ncbi:C40 family peptidase [Sphaerisporangium melleum]|nr:C40 family peptidase [Sphaerisporangium melleum]
MTTVTTVTTLVAGVLGAAGACPGPAWGAVAARSSPVARLAAGAHAIGLRTAGSRVAALPGGGAIWTPGPWAASWARRRHTGAGPGDRVANWALTQLGKPYVWAAAGPHAYDCSGLTMRAWQRAGVALPHWTGTQWLSGPRVTADGLRRGDLLFFGRSPLDPRSIGHVGVYIGGGQMVHAPRTGDVVRIATMWRPNLVGVVRPRRQGPA